MLVAEDQVVNIFSDAAVSPSLLSELGETCHKRLSDVWLITALHICEMQNQYING
jgi:hypothetical protein